MKKILALLVVFILIFCLSACGESSSGNENPPEEYESSETENHTSSEAESEEPVDTVQPLDFETVSVVEDINGYKIRCTFTYTPWICADQNLEVVNRTWEKIGNGHTLTQPDTSSWHVRKVGDFYNTGSPGTSAIGINRFHYIMGTVKFENITEGDWHLTGNNNCSPVGTIVSSGDTREFLINGNIFYNGKTSTEQGYLRINPKMTSDIWGPVPFVMVLFDYVSPEYPDGYYSKYLNESIQFGCGLEIATVKPTIYKP